MEPELDAERWRILEPLIDAVLEAPPEQRARLVGELAGADLALRSELLGLLAQDGALPLLARPAAEVFGALVAADSADLRSALGRALAGRYRIEREIGAGGMALVYLARDLRHDRLVALKVLRPELAAVVGAGRFLAEIRTTANLQHPHILPLHDSGEVEGFLYFVMPYVEGETLRDRIAREGPLPLPDAIRILREIADGLACAHERGIVHRDIKPGNILLSGKHAIVSDFGVAKALTGSAARADGTATGLAIGTPTYMAPEQASGTDEVGQPADIYAFGVLAYEALTGKPPFEAPTTGQILVKHLTEAPDPVALRRADLPGALGTLVMRCLEKDPAARWPTAHAMLAELEALSAERGSRGEPRARPRRRVATAFVLGLTLGTGALAYLIYGPGEAVSSPGFRLENVRRATIMPGNESTPSLSPDGKWVAFASDATGNRDIWIKNLDGGEPIRLTTDPAEDYDPAWSPDGSTIAFRSNRAGGGLYAMPAFSGEAVRLVDFGFRPRWSPDGSKLLFQLRAFDFIPNEVYVMGYRPRSEPEVVLDFVSDGDPFNQAEWSPDGTRLMYHTGSYIAGAGIAVRSLKPPGTESFVRYQDDAKVNRPDPIWTPDGRGLISSGQGSLLYLPFDSELRVTQAPTQLTTGSPSTPHRAPSLSRDGSRLAFSGAASQSDIWKVAMDPATGMPVGTPVRVIAHPSNDLNPTLLPDGKHILFASDRDGAYHIYVADTAGANVRLVDSSNPVRRGGINSLSPDGRWLLVTSPNLRQHLVPFDPDRIEVLGPWRDFEVAGQKGAYRSWSWSPDGRRVTATTTQERSWTGITIIDDPTGEAPRDSVWPIDPRFIEQYPNRVRGFFSPDGEWVTFGAYKDRDKPSVFTVRRGSTEPQLLWTGSGFNDWMDPDRIHIWGEAGYENEDRLGFVDIDRATGKPTGGLRILDLRPARGTINIYEAALTKDHRWLFFGFTETEGDIYVGDVRSGR